MMKKVLVTVVALAVAFVFSSAALAAAPKTHSFSGTVVSVDAIGNTLMVKHEKVTESFQVEPTAKIMIHNKEVKLGDIKKDEKVVVTYRVEEGKKLASEIR